MGAGLKSLAADLAVTHEALYRCVANCGKGGAAPGGGVSGPDQLRTPVNRIPQVRDSTSGVHAQNRFNSDRRV